jgi:hypothetical protein
MPKLISGYIRKQVAKYLGPQVLSGTLIKVTAGTRGATVSSGTQPTETSFACKLFVRDYSDEEMAGTGIKTSDRRIAILGGTIAGGQVPSPNDKISYVRRGSTETYRIVDDGVSTDPDEAVYVCRARR